MPANVITHWAGAVPVHLLRHFSLGMYRLATMHSVTDRQTDRRQYHATIRSCCVQQYDRLKRKRFLEVCSEPVKLTE